MLHRILSILIFSFLVSGHFYLQGQEAWQIQDSGVQASLRGLCVVDSKTVWSSGSGGTVIRTTDAGKTWDNVSVKEAKELDFRDIQAFDARRAVILSAGQPARIYRTENGGKSWKVTFEHPDKRSFFDALSFWDQQHGIAMSDPIDDRVLLIETRDGGSSWKELPTGHRPKSLRGEAGFAASGTNMIVFGDRCLIALGSGEKDQQENSSRIVFSNDRGKTWQAVQVPIQRNPSRGIFSLAFANKTHGIAVGGDYQNQKLADYNIAITRDGGSSWQRPDGVVPRGYRSAVTYFERGNPSKLIAVGPTGTDISIDSGKNWMAASDKGFHAVAFTPDGKAGWASGADGRIAKWAR